MKAAVIVSMILNLFIGLSMGTSAFAQDEPKAAAPQKVDTKNIEAKYWQPSDESYSVVQTRTYAKAKKFGVSLQTGPILMDSWSEGFSFEAAASYYFTERWGVELQAGVYSTDDNDSVDAIFALGGVPDFGRVTSFYGAMARWVPFYSKMSFMGTKVVYFDMSFGLGAGLISYEQQRQVSTSDTTRTEVSQTAPAIQFDISQTYFINPKLAFRVDYKMRFFNEEVIAYNTKPGVAIGEKIEDKVTNASSLNLGVTYYF